MAKSDPNSEGREDGVGRREFLLKAGLAVAGAVAGVPGLATAQPSRRETSETLVVQLYGTLTEAQRRAICFAWDHRDPQRGLLRAFISNNWRVTPQAIHSDFYTRDQQALIRAIFEGLVNPEWLRRFDRQFRDDLGGFGERQGIALFGQPGGEGPFQFVLSGRHGTFRCDGNSTDHVAFGGPIVYGHEGRGYFETADHPDNVFWPQAELANRLYQMLDGRQRQTALCAEAPDEARIGFRGAQDGFEGIPVANLSRDQKEHAQRVLARLIEPFRRCDRDEVMAALRTQGGLDRCHLAFYRADDLGDDGVWDNWRLEGPAFVWHYRGAPHVHVWVSVADDPTVTLNARNLSGALRR